MPLSHTFLSYVFSKVLPLVFSSSVYYSRCSVSIHCLSLSFCSFSLPGLLPRRFLCVRHQWFPAEGPPPCVEGQEVEPSLVYLSIPACLSLPPWLLLMSFRKHMSRICLPRDCALWWAIKQNFLSLTLLARIPGADLWFRSLVNMRNIGYIMRLAEILLKTPLFSTFKLLTWP